MLRSTRARDISQNTSETTRSPKRIPTASELKVMYAEEHASYLETCTQLQVS